MRLDVLVHGRLTYWIPRHGWACGWSRGADS